MFCLRVPQEQQHVPKNTLHATATHVLQVTFVTQETAILCVTLIHAHRTLHFILLDQNNSSPQLC
jgi:hypothetical protein